MALGAILERYGGGNNPQLSTDVYLTQGASPYGLICSINVVAGTPKVFPPLLQLIQGHCGDKLPA